MNGYVIEDVTDPNDPTKVVLQKGKQVVNFSVLRDDGKTASGCWIYSGCFNEQGNNMARRDTSDPDGVGVYPKWAFSWPLNRRVLYNRASCDLAGKPWDPSRNSSSGTAPNGRATMCPTLRRPPSRTWSARSS